MFMKARYRRMGTKPDGCPVIDIQGVVQGTTIGICPGSAYALRDALSAALEDYENDCEGTGKKTWKHRESPNHSSGSTTECPRCGGRGHVGPM